MKSLFPDMEAELAQDRVAERREAKQLARQYIALHSGFEKFIMNHLKEHGPSVDANMMLAMFELTEVGKAEYMMRVMTTAMAMWRVGILWRREFPNHPSNERCYTYGIKGTHQRPS